MSASQSRADVASRHGILPARYRKSRRSLARQCRIFKETQYDFSSRRDWRVLVRIWLKISLTGDEVVELIKCIEMPPGGQPSEIGHCPSPAADIRWAEKAPVKLYELKRIVETGIRFAADLVSIEARNLQNRQMCDRLPALERMRAYYRQLAVDAAGSECQEADAIRSEYRRRLHEEIHFARVKAKLALIALETISTPAQRLTWKLRRNTQTKEVVSVVDLYSGKVATPVRCGFCRDKIDMFGLSQSNEVVCEGCRAGHRQPEDHDNVNPSKGGIAQSCPKTNHQMTLFKDHWHPGPR